MQKRCAELLVEGKIQTRSWDDKASGEKKYKTEILVQRTNSPRRQGRAATKVAAASYAEDPTPSCIFLPSYDQRQPTSAPDYGNDGITDDDIPF